MIDGADLEGPARLSPPQSTTPEKSCSQSNESVDGLALEPLAFVPTTSCRSWTRVIGSAMSAYLL
jgi:hypothetical protein